MTDLRLLAAERSRRLASVVRRGAGAVGSAVRPLVRRSPEIVVAAAAVLTVLCALVLVGASRNDASIEADTGRAVAEVLDGSSSQRTFVRFTAADGAVLTPEDGVFYPRGLEAGQLVRVEYDRSDPELVRVEGRDWTEGLVPILLGVAGIWLVLGTTAWWLGRRRRTRRAGRAAAESADESPDEPGRAPVGAGSR